MLVGDAIIKIRTAITDMPGTLPVASSSAVVVSSPGSTLFTGAYSVVITQRTPWGETLPDAEIQSLLVSAGQGIQIGGTLLPTAIAIRAYLTFPGGASGTEFQFVESPTSPFVISANPTAAASPPTRNTAYNPDASGDSLSSATLYDWLNDGLKKASQIVGGLIDYAGVSTIVGNPTYIVPGQWKNIGDVWYDGYPLAPDKVGNFFRRNSITASVLSQVAMSILDNRVALEVWPQPARTAASTTLAVAMSAASTSLTAASLSNFLLTNGMVQVDNEIMSYAGMPGGNQLTNLIRGLGGSSAAAHAVGAPVAELNLFFHGWRKFFPVYQPGQSALTIPIPVDWDPFIILYGLSRAKLAEQNIQEWQALDKAFTDELSQWSRTNRIVVGPRQVGDQSAQLEVIPTLGGGWIVP